MRSSRRTLKDEMSNTDSSDDQALAESKPVTNKGTIGYGEGDSLLQRSLATYRYENALVKTELATALDRHTREVSELKHKYEAQMSNTDSSDDQALAESKPVTNKGTIGYGEGDSLLQRSLATYRYENALVKTELATALDRHTREVSELKHKYEAQMSNTDSSDDQALAESKPVTNKGTIGYGEGDSLLQRSLATYRYENALVKTELATALDRHTREVSELKHKYEAQMKDVERQRDILEKRLNDVQDKYTEENRRLQQTNLHLQQCLQSAEGELEAATKSFEAATKEKIQAEEDWQQRLIANQKTVQALKEEKNHLSENVDRLHGELEKERITSREITTTLNAERHQQQLIQSRLSEVEQQCKIQLTSAQTEVSKLREKLEKESAMASKKINELTSSLEEERLAIVRTKERANAKEHELEKRLAEQKQSMLVNSQQQIQQNSSLQERIKGLETTLNHCESKKDTKINDLEIKEQHIMEKLHEAERKKVVLEARVTALESLEGLLRKEREDSSTLRQELHQYRSEGEELQRLNAEFQQQVQNLKNKLAEHEKEKVSIKEEAKKEVGIGQRIMAEQQEAHREELEQLRTRLSSLQTNFNDRNKSYLDECTQLKQKVRTYAKLIKKLRHKLEMGEVHLEQLEAQHEVLKNNVPSDVHRRLQFQLQSITRKHNEFAAFIRGLNEFRSALPEISELTNQLGAVDLKINELEEDQLHCLSELESL